MNKYFIYASLFIALVLAYLIFFIVWYVNRPKSVEHFTVDLADKITQKSDCKTYNMRQEVINIFYTYMRRKPTADEIAKYSVAGNEQDVLTMIMQDFKIGSIDIEQKLGDLEAMRVDTCLPSPDNKSFVTVTEENSIQSVDEEWSFQKNYSNEYYKDIDSIVLSKTKYQDIKKKIQDLMLDVDKLGM